eukprot:7383460-Prymnesium_polylepis.1
MNHGHRVHPTLPEECLEGCQRRGKDLRHPERSTRSLFVHTDRRGDSLQRIAAGETALVSRSACWLSVRAEGAAA